MLVSVTAKSVPEAFPELMWALRTSGIKEDSRNGPVITIPGPFLLTIMHPLQRILFCPVRNANPFFHLMETVWMFAGYRNTAWLKRFNSRIDSYANDGIIHGAYGFRWFNEWGNQIRSVSILLRNQPNTRQAVIQMWDPLSDLKPHWNDRPCNTQIMFRLNNRAQLDMTVINRSNDVIWGMLGANVVHMTYLHEYMSHATGIPLGVYRVFSNNAHFYTEAYPNGKEMWNNFVEGPNPYPLELGPPFSPSLHECCEFIDGEGDLESRWLMEVAMPAKQAYLAKTLEGRLSHCQLITDPGWRVACTEWIIRNHKDKP